MSRTEVRTKLRDDPPKPLEPEWRPSRLALQLALAVRIERAIESGELRDYADAARRLGLTRARVTQLAVLAALPTAVQDSLFTSSPERRELRRAGRLGTARW